MSQRSTIIRGYAPQNSVRRLGTHSCIWSSRREGSREFRRFLEGESHSKTEYGRGGCGRYPLESSLEGPLSVPHDVPPVDVKLRHPFSIQILPLVRTVAKRKRGRYAPSSRTLRGGCIWVFRTVRRCQPQASWYWVMVQRAVPTSRSTNGDNGGVDRT